MATKEMDSPLEAREDRLKRKAARKSAKADRLEARGKTKRAAKKRGAAAVKTAKADKIAGKQDAKDAKQKGRQDKKMAKVEKRQEKKKSRKAKLKKVSINNAKKAGKKALNTAGKKLVEKTGGPEMYGGKKGDESKSRRDYEGTSMYDMSVPGEKLKYIQGSSSGKYDNVGGPSMSGKAYDNKEAYNKNLSDSARLHYLENERHDDEKGGPSMHGKGGSSMSKHFHRNRK